MNDIYGYSEEGRVYDSLAMMIHGFYKEDGTFQPLVDNYGNTSGKIAHFRDTFMEAERDYFESLLLDQKVRDEFYLMIKILSNEELFDAAMKIYHDLETGNLETSDDKKLMESMSAEEADSFHMHKLEAAESYMCLLLAAIRDKARILELVENINMNQGRSK